MGNMVSVRNEHDLLLKLETAGLNDKLAQVVNGSKGNKLAAKIVELIKNVARLQMVGNHTIDTDIAPFIPRGLKEVAEHKGMGQVTFEPSKLSLYLSKKQENGGVIEGNKLRKELEGKPVANANVLDYLLAHPELIPEEWKSKVVFFWGTIYRFSGGGLCVRCLYWRGDRWCSACFWLDSVWHDSRPALLCASA